MGDHFSSLTRWEVLSFSKCVSRPSSSLSLFAPSLWTPISTRKSVKRNVVASSRDSARTTGLDTLQGTGPAMTGTTATTPARAEPTTTTRGRPRPRPTPPLWLSQRLTQTPSTVTTAMVLDTPMAMVLGTPMAMVLGTLMEMASATPMGILWHMLMAPTVTDLDMVWATFTDPPVVPFTNT